MTAGALLIVAALIASVWIALLGTAYLMRAGGYGHASSLVAVTGCYLALAACALIWLGPRSNGALGAVGMLAPYATAVALALYPRP